MESLWSQDVEEAKSRGRGVLRSFESCEVEKLGVGKSELSLYLFPKVSKTQISLLKRQNSGLNTWSNIELFRRDGDRFHV